MLKQEAGNLMDRTDCANCHAALVWNGEYACCAACGLWHSRLQPRVLDEQAWASLDEAARGVALQTLRYSNFRLVLDRLQQLSGERRGRLLDIGCAHGWFLEQARARGFECSGLEPDPRLASHARQHGSSVREGFFPAALAADERFDVLVFNDVFEHLPDPAVALQACFRHLAPGGRLVLNLPLASGFLFRVAGVLRAIGVQGPWARMWQVGFPSPHLYFFQSRHLQQLCTREGLQPEYQGSLHTLAGGAGLWERLRMDRQAPLWLHAMQWSLLVVLAPLLRFLPADIGLLIFRKH